MSATTTRTTDPALRRTFPLVVCGVDGSRAATVAVEQAATLAGDGELTLLAVSYAIGSGSIEMADLAEHNAQRALTEARASARTSGVDAVTEIVHARDAASALLKRATDADLLVVGAPVSGRGQGIMLGATATRVLHRATMPVLAARRAPAGTAFPKRILVATDGSGGTRAAVSLAAEIAVEHHAQVALLHAGSPAGETERRRIADQAVELREATGVEPVCLDPSDDPVDAIVAAARSLGASLVVTGARGVSGLRALGSVSERVAHRAPCSVLVVRD